MAFTINSNYLVYAPDAIDTRMLVDRVDGTTSSLVSLDTTFNYRNMYVWVREEKSFYYLIDSPEEGGATVSDWSQASGGATAGCAKSGYVPGTSFTGLPVGIATASVFFSSPYQSASYSVVVTLEENSPSYVYSVTDKSPTGFTIVIDSPVPIGATAMWITNCWDGSGLFNGVGGGPGGGSAIDLEEIAFGTGTGITSSDVFTFDNSNTSLILGFDNKITSSRSSAIIGGTGNTINSSTIGVIDSNLITSAKSSNVKDSFYSSIQSSLDSKICSSTASSILSSNDNSRICKSFYSILISNCSSVICGSRNSNIISSYFGFMTQSNCSSIIGSYQSGICNSNNSVIIGNYNGTIKNSSLSTMIGGGFNCIDNTGIPGSFNYGGIVFGVLNKLCNSVSSSSIFSGSSNIISGTLSARDNIILGGNDNKIYGLSKYSSIVGGVTNSMTASYHSSIIGGYFNKICGGIGGGTTPVKYSSIIGGYKNKISSTFKSGKSENSVIIGGCNNSISNARNSAIIGGTGLSINAGASNPTALENVVYVPSLKGHGSLQLQVTTSSTDIYLDDTNFTLIAYPPVGGMTVSLPSANYAPNRLYIIKKDGSSTQSVVYIEPNSFNPDTIEGYAGSIELINPWDYNILQSDGVNMWIKLGGAVGINL